MEIASRHAVQSGVETTALHSRARTRTTRRSSHHSESRSSIARRSARSRALRKIETQRRQGAKSGAKYGIPTLNLIAVFFARPSLLCCFAFLAWVTIDLECARLDAAFSGAGLTAPIEIQPTSRASLSESGVETTALHRRARTRTTRRSSLHSESGSKIAVGQRACARSECRGVPCGRPIPVPDQANVARRSQASARDAPTGTGSIWSARGLTPLFQVPA